MIPQLIMKPRIDTDKHGFWESKLGAPFFSFICVHPWFNFFWMVASQLTLICFAVKEEAAPFKAALGSRLDIQILLTGMGQSNADKSIRFALSQQRTAAVSETSRGNVPLPNAFASEEITPSLPESTIPSFHQSAWSSRAASLAP